MSTTHTQMLRYIPADQIQPVITGLSDCVVSKRVLKLLLSRQYRQRTDDWHEKRKSILTASDCATAIDLNKFQTRNELIRKKAGLVGLLGAKTEDLSKNPAIMHGVKYEDEAADIYMCQNPHLAPFFEVGLIMHDVHQFLGASPDRITKDGILIEIKVRLLLTWLFYQLIFSSFET